MDMLLRFKKNLIKNVLCEVYCSNFAHLLLMKFSDFLCNLIGNFAFWILFLLPLLNYKLYSLDFCFFISILLTFFKNAWSSNYLSFNDIDVLKRIVGRNWHHRPGKEDYEISSMYFIFLFCNCLPWKKRWTFLRTNR